MSVSVTGRGHGRGRDEARELLIGLGLGKGEMGLGLGLGFRDRAEHLEAGDGVGDDRVDGGMLRAMEAPTHAARRPQLHARLRLARVRALGF